ncbi:NLR family CARD domain-containing protein 3-like [Brienomyrus brachyistius]|uniref:NLR family CARD domain-containing protein 3-like n=1 Tax=Brienomyrus brachyistius TaxID=42636 RepID=UPI0020B30840|nr:NLR family CARD domain-containing protein 3-like [Brienomyrus brachyistius]
MERSESPAPSCLSMKSDGSMRPPIEFKEEDPFDTSPQMERSESPAPSCLSMKSDGSMRPPIEFKGESSFDTSCQVDQPESPVPGSLSKKKDMNGDIDQKEKLIQPELQEMQNSRRLLKIQQTLKAILKRKYEHVFEGTAKQGDAAFVSDIYTDLYITEAENEWVNEHEMRQIETRFRNQIRQERAIHCNGIFIPFSGQEHPIRTVLTMGIAGIGKTVSVQKFILDWAEGKANQDVHFMFPLQFRDLNLEEGKKFSLMGLLHHYFPELRKMKQCEFDQFKVLFIFDGLDECRFFLDFQNCDDCSDIREVTELDVLLTNLIKGSLLPSAHLWITSRPAAASQIPPECVHRVTEIRGFNDPQKDEYFRKKIGNKTMAKKVISYLQKLKSLYTMCHIPVFCWISATVLKMLDEDEVIPTSLTQMYIHFLLIQTNIIEQKYHQRKMKNKSLQSNKIIFKLSKLAFLQLEKGQLLFYEQDLKECGIHQEEASIYSGLCTEMFKKEDVMSQKKVYSFVHLSVQEFLAALYVFHVHRTSICNLPLLDKTHADTLTSQIVLNLHKSAVDQALASDRGHLDLFLRFLLGISLDNNQKLLQVLLPESISLNIEGINQYIRKKIKENLSTEKTMNLLYCLNELNDTGLIKKVQSFLRSGNLSDQSLSVVHWSALVFVLLTSEEVQDVFDLKKYIRSDEALEKLLPVIKYSRVALLDQCKLTEQGCESLTTVLGSEYTLLRKLDLSDNDLQDSGVRLLSVGLGSSQCKLEILRLNRCSLSEKCCEWLALALSSNSSNLKQLDLSDNDLQDLGVKQLSNGLGNQHCKLEILRLSLCQISEVGCTSLASALHSNPSHLRELDLSYNHPGESGLRLLSACLEDPSFKLKKLNVDHSAECRILPVPRKYTCRPTLDPNTVNVNLILSDENRNVAWRTEEQPYPDHPHRFDCWEQVLCSEGLADRCYWEAEWGGTYGVTIGMSYKGIGRKGLGDDSRLGYNDKSWVLYCTNKNYIAIHNKKDTEIAIQDFTQRIAVYLDQPAGILSFYSVSSGKLTLVHRFQSTFTEPLYPGFWVSKSGSTVSLCHLEELPM